MFVIYDTGRFMREVVPRYFRLTSFKSFARQMNIYDFHKCKMGYERGLYFYHPYFQKGKPSLLNKIIRQSNKSHPKFERKRDAKQGEKSASESSRSIKKAKNSLVSQPEIQKMDKKAGKRSLMVRIDLATG